VRAACTKAGHCPAARVQRCSPVLDMAAAAAAGTRDPEREHLPNQEGASVCGEKRSTTARSSSFTPRHRITGAHQRR
jgi:hypothetical protein